VFFNDRSLGYAVLSLAVPLLCASCAGTAQSPTLTGGLSRTVREGYVDVEKWEAKQAS
jgi:hypothetical protein